MVLYFSSSAVKPPATIYMGKGKFENEDLIKHGWPEDVWFHVEQAAASPHQVSFKYPHNVKRVEETRAKNNQMKRIQAEERRIAEARRKDKESRDSTQPFVEMRMSKDGKPAKVPENTFGDNDFADRL
ncbi:Coiled-coil domain-containing protein 25 [Coemansia sp. RSA 552]|nr:Coiled-coil domain-containing protein 25 [Coemansia sp. RSA 552]